MTERQNIGFEFEQLCNNMLGSLELNDGYTDADDGYFVLSSGRRIRVSLKCISETGEVCLGDVFRIVENSEPVLMLVGHHKPRQMPQHIDAYWLPSGFPGIMHGLAPRIAKLCHDFHDYMLGDENFNERNYDKYWTQERKNFLDAYHAIFGDNTAFIHPRPKRDHKNQRRLQCAIPTRYKDELRRNYGVASLDMPSNIVRDASGSVFHSTAGNNVWDDFEECINEALH